MSERTFYVVCKDDCLTEGMSKEQILTAIEQGLAQGYVSDPDSAVFSKIKEICANSATQIWVGTEAQFNAISPAPTIGKSVVRVGTDGVLYLCSDDSTLNDLSKHLKDKSNPHGVTFEQVVGGSVVPVSKGGTGATDAATARNNLGAAASSHNHNIGNLEGTLPITKGGTGATDAATALNNLSAFPITGGTVTGNLEVSKAGGFNYSGIEEATQSAYRNVWFSHAIAKGKPCYSDKFRFDPDSGNIALYGDFEKRVDSNGTYTRYGASESGLSIESTYQDGVRRCLWIDNPFSTSDPRYAVKIGNFDNSTWNTYFIPVQTDWIQLTPADGVTTPGEYGNGVLRYRAEGKHVYVAGSINAAWDGTNNKLIATLPSGYRPANGNCYFLQPRGGQNIARVFINTSGEIYIEWVKSLYDQSNNTGSGWFDLHMDFWTD